MWIYNLKILDLRIDMEFPLLLLMRSLIESTIKWRFDFFKACMNVMKGYLIDIEEPDDRKFFYRKKK